MLRLNATSPRAHASYLRLGALSVNRSAAEPLPDRPTVEARPLLHEGTMGPAHSAEVIMTDNIKGRVTLRVSESTSAGAVLALVQRLQASADLVSMTPNPDDSVEITVDTPHEVATFFEELDGIVSAQQVDEDIPGTLTYEVTLEDLVAGS